MGSPLALHSNSKKSPTSISCGDGGEIDTTGASVKVIHGVIGYSGN